MGGKTSSSEPPAETADLNESPSNTKATNVIFNNNSYKFINSGRKGINELAYALTNGNLSYPMTVFLDENYNLITLLPGYHKPDFYKKVLSYIGNDFWKNMTWEEYLKNN